jgi:DsbC/DsbD-like thiol-disulfide interchange protein
VLQGLWRRTGNLAYRQQTEALIDRFAATLTRQPHNHSSMLTAITSHREGELQSHAYAAQGGIRLSGKLSPHTTQSLRLTVTLEIPPGWHIYSAQPGDNDLIGTHLHLTDSVSGWELGPVTYPEGARQHLAFQERPVSLISGLVRFEALVTQITAAPHSTLPVGVRMQACNDPVCLPPETPLLRIHRPH